MKRWQHRGEVEDSEDEELTLDSPSPERPLKRAKGHRDVVSTGSQEFEAELPPALDHAVDKEDELAWLPAKVANTYGRKGKLTRPTRRAPVLHLKRGDTAPVSCLDTAPLHSPSRSIFEHVQTNPAVSKSPNRAPLHQDAETSRELIPSDTSTQELPSVPAQITSQVLSAPALHVNEQLSQVEPPTTPLVFADDGSSLPDSDGEDLPDVRDLFAAARPRPVSLHASSPLSERDVSPPAPFAQVRDESGAEALPERTSAQDEIDLHDELLWQSMLDNDTTDARPTRRSLRARKDIQLHPYLIDKAKYQRQCKERGIKPVRLVDTQPHQDRSQEQPESSQHSVPESIASGTAAPDHLLRGRPLAYVRLGDAGTAFDHRFGIERTAKRRRVSEKGGRAARRDVFNVASEGGQMHGADLSMPPSPPRTSSETSTPGMPNDPSARKISGFRRAPALSPVALPTPHVSSAIRTRKTHSAHEFPADLDPGSPGNIVQARSQDVGTDSEQSAMSEEEAESDGEHIARRLQREQKRIKGVLPASWLRIDFRAQKQPKPPSSTARARNTTVSPERSTPQRGLAKRIVGTRGSTIDKSDTVTAVSDDGADSDDSVQPVRAGLHQSLLLPHEGRITVGTHELVDENDMENDFVDPMLAGSGRRLKSNWSTSRQPRITSQFRKYSSTADPFSKERTRPRQEIGQSRRAAQGRGPMPARTSRQAPVKLSIVDALSEGVAASVSVPRFVRLAMRQARKLPDHGRHSPTHKVIHLATAEDTRDATSVLRMWREGTLLPQSRSTSLREPRDSISSEHRFTASAETTAEQQRWPLVEVDFNAERHHTTDTPAVRFKGTTTPMSRTRRPRPSHKDLGTVALRTRRPTYTSRTNTVQTRGIQAGPLPGAVRDAQLETVQAEFDQRHRAAVFERRMQCLTETVAVHGRHANKTSFPITNYLQQAEPEIASARTNEAERQSIAELTANDQHNQQWRTLTHRPRKRQAQGLNIDAPQYRQPVDTASEHSEDPKDNFVTDVTKPVLQGLGAFGTIYPVDFGFKPLPPGRYLCQNTFIGGGDLHDALALASHNLDAARGRISLHLGDDVMTLSIWNEDVSSAFARLPTTINSLLERNVRTDGHAAQRETIAYLLRSIIRYLSKCLSFVDQVDRQSCLDSLQHLVLDLQDVVVEHQASSSADRGVIILIMEYQVVLAHQATQLSIHASTTEHTRRELRELLARSARALSSLAMTNSFWELQKWYDGVQSVRGITSDDQSVVSTLVILNHTAGIDSTGSDLWAAIEHSLAVDMDTMYSIKDFEAVWQHLFALLPVLCITPEGVVDDASPPASMATGWTIVRKVMTRVFELFEDTSRVRGFSTNVYVRSLLHRCYRLIETWRWGRCETILYTLYDFFSKQSRMLLKNEECKGSPTFLENLSSRPNLEPMPEDLSFHIFLKTLAEGLQVMREQRVYSERKIGASVTYRMIPTHGRTYPKEKDMRQDDVDALRNHHDLLCTLYYASPAGHRVGLEILRNLVDHANWHRKACQLNIKAWSMLAAFQSSTGEPSDELKPLMVWYADMMRLTITQYRLARSEAEHDFHHARGVGADITEAFLYGTIATNQVQIALSLVDALSGLKRALEVASSLAVVQTLIQKSDFWTVLELFDTSQRRLISTAHQALLVIEAALSAESKLAEQQETSQTNSSSTDSQEFGDFSALDELVAAENTGSTTYATIAMDLLSPMSSFLSSLIGADHLPDDTLLEHSVRVWIRLAKDLVKSGQRNWTSYVDEYSPNSWAQMRDTKQKRKLTPYYMSCVIEQASADDTVRQMVCTSWLCSLVEREAVLKFQHTLTSSLLNHCEQESLLQNLPFARDLRTGRFQVSLEDFRQRRLSLISSVLSNMRRMLLINRREAPMQVPEVKMRYADMLRQLMNTMKCNYQELQTCQSTGVADESVQGAYVEFVQEVVTLLQEHTADFCHIDKFFTDSSAFPLPAADPTYVVGKLKGYALKLGDSGPRRELAMFLQSVNERAAVDRQQPYLVTQMATAMCAQAESGDSAAPTLRHVLLTSIFPAYLDRSFSFACGWILSLPLLQACRIVLQDALYTLDVNSEASTISTAETLTIILHSLYGLLGQALTPDILVGEWSVLRLLVATCEVCTAALTTTSYIQRSSTCGTDLLGVMRALYLRTHDLNRHVRHAPAPEHLDNLLHSIELACPWADTRAFAERQVNDATNYWYKAHGRYYVRRGSISKEVEVQLGCAAEEKSALLNAIADFQESYEATFDVKRARRQKLVDNDICAGLSV